MFNQPRLAPLSCGEYHGIVDLHAWTDAYLDHLRIERALARNTVESYARDLSKLLEVAEREGISSPDGIDMALVSTYMVELGVRGLGARSASRHLSAVRGFCRFLVRERALEANPCDLIDRPSTRRKLPVWLDEDEVGRLLAAPDPGTPRGLKRPGDASLDVRGGAACQRVGIAEDGQRRLSTRVGDGGGQGAARRASYPWESWLSMPCSGIWSMSGSRRTSSMRRRSSCHHVVVR